MLRRIVHSLFLFPAAVIFLFAQESSVNIPNSGFEKQFSGWQIEGTLPPSGKIQIDDANRHSGNSCISLYNARYGSLTLTSEKIQLTAGALYRLSGWVKTLDASADPTLRYPTPVAAVMTMESFPFTNHSSAGGGTHEWKKIEVLFFATQKEDRIRLHLGYNGTASGQALFDDISLEQVDDISEYIAPETVRWFDKAFRYTDKGWIFVHIEGAPYQRGYQYGYLLAKEISAYIEKIATRYNPDNPKAAWTEKRTLTDALMLRGFDEEYLTEMKGIADGAAKAGAAFGGKPVDFLDIVTVNCIVDLGQLTDALNETSHGMSGRNFRKEEEELNAPERLHKCSSFLANGPATKDGKIVFSQMFMWNGYTGVHWDVICDVVPEQGHRLVYQTFPGGIHSGADFYINDAGIMIGETTTAQTPFDAAGTPQSYRIRKAAQYGGSIDDVVKILTEKNNGLYTNDWMIGDLNTNEIAILLLGTKKFKLWRSSKDEYPGGTTGFLWSVNNAKDPEVRKEFIPDPSNAPFDFIYGNVNRDISFFQYYQKEKGNIDGASAMRVIATSPINRPHACDGKVTTAEMAKQLMFFAHYGKTTLREKFPEKNYRLLPDLTNAAPHLTLGYSVINPVYITEKLKALRNKPQSVEPVKRNPNFSEIKEIYSYPKRLLWFNTVFPKTEGDNWIVSASAAYWSMLNSLPPDEKSASVSLSDGLRELNCRLQYTLANESAVPPSAAARRYDRFSDYVVPKIRGIFALHQLRLKIGNEKFSQLMNTLHDQFREKPLSTDQFIAKAEEISSLSLKQFIRQWIDRTTFPMIRFTASSEKNDSGYLIHAACSQPENYYSFVTTVSIETEKEVIVKIINVTEPAQSFSFSVAGTPLKATLNIGNGLPVERKKYFTFSNFFDDFSTGKIIYGTSRQIEANRTLSLRYQTILADAFTEILPPVMQDNEVNDEILRTSDLLLLGEPADNSILASVAKLSGIEFGKNYFRWGGKEYSLPDDGLVVVVPNPFNNRKTAYCIIANSALQLWQMTKRHQSSPSWSIWKGDQILERGFHAAESTEVVF